MLMAFKMHTHLGRVSVNVGAKYTVVPVAIMLQTRPHSDKVDGATQVGTNVTTHRQNLCFVSAVCTGLEETWASYGCIYGSRIVLDHAL